MIGLIKDDIYSFDCYLIVSSKEEKEPETRKFYKKKKMEYDISKELTKFCAMHYEISGDGYRHFWIWVDKKTIDRSWKETVISTSHELIHHIDKVFMEIGLQKDKFLVQTTEARAYYFEYLLRQALNILYPIKKKVNSKKVIK